VAWATLITHAHVHGLVRAAVLNRSAHPQHTVLQRDGDARKRRRKGKQTAATHHEEFDQGVRSRHADGVADDRARSRRHRRADVGRLRVARRAEATRRRS
jgi:hypothetical protein